MGKSSFLQNLGVEVPIIQAPMAGVSTPGLAAAVSNANGLGSLGIAALRPAQAGEAIAQTRQLTTGPINVNVFCHTAPSPNPESTARWLHYLEEHFTALGATRPKELDLPYKSFDEQKDLLTLLLDIRPAVVSFHFGLPSQASIRRLQGVGIKLMATATNVAEAQAIAAAGLDAVIAQGFEAGGHRGVFQPNERDEKLTTATLTQLLSYTIPLPVIAAGGVMNGAGIAALLTLGAEAVQFGTAFIASPESNADAAYRAALLKGAETGTVMTTAISGRPARGLANLFTALGEHPSCPPAPPYPLAYAAGKLLHAAASARGSSDYAAHWAGQSVAMIRPMAAAQLVRTLAEEWRTAEKG